MTASLPKAKKHLSQNFLTDREVLESIASEAHVVSGEWVLEIGPGRGALTEVLLELGARVVAVEFDQELAERLAHVFARNPQVTVVSGDILEKSLRAWLPDECESFKVVANIPYAITAPIVQKILTEPERPSLATLLVQQEVALRLAGTEKERSVLSVVAGYYADMTLGPWIPREHFDPVPKVESQVVTLVPTRPVLPEDRGFFRLVKFGFQARRKKLASNLASGLQMSKEMVEGELVSLGKSKDARAQELTVEEWLLLWQALAQH